MSYPEVTVSAVIFNKDKKILLCKSHKWNNQYVIPGGHIELGESMEDALKREVAEETGLSIYDIQLIGIKECIYSEKFHKRKHFIFMDYISKSDEEDVILNDEAEEYIWINMKDIDKYEFGGFTKDLLNMVKENNKDKKIEIYYNY